MSESSSSASVSRLSTPHSEFSDSFGTPISDEDSRIFAEESYETFDNVRRSLDMDKVSHSPPARDDVRRSSRSPQVRMRKFEDSLDDGSDDESDGFRPRGNASEWKRRSSSQSIPKPQFQGEEAMVYSETEGSSDEEHDDLEPHYQEASIHSGGALDDYGISPCTRLFQNGRIALRQQVQSLHRHQCENHQSLRRRHRQRMTPTHL